MRLGGPSRLLAGNDRVSIGQRTAEQDEQPRAAMVTRDARGLNAIMGESPVEAGQSAIRPTPLS